MVRRLLLVCGIVSTLLWIGADIVAAMRYEGYSYIAQAPSELSAIGAPTRSMLAPVGVVYEILIIALGFGVWLSAGEKQSLRITAALLMAFGAFGLLWPLAPMHPRGAETSMTDTMHIVMSAVTVVFIVLLTGFGSDVDGKRFQRYSIATLLTCLVFGAGTGMYVPRVIANESTPWLGLTERISVYAFMIWVAMLAAVLVRARSPHRIEDGAFTGPLHPIAR
jgi:hypothetical protein